MGISVQTMKEKMSEDFINAGREIERVWLAASIRKMSIQPLAGLIYVYQRVFEKENNNILSIEEIDITEKSFNKIKLYVPNSDIMIPMIFRIGYSNTSSAKSSKLEPKFI